MVYVADLHRNGLIKIGITGERREKARQRELRVHFNEPLLEIVAGYTIPRGWGTDHEWEQQLLNNLRLRGERLQMFAMQHSSTEVVEATTAEAQVEILAMLRTTEVDPHARADALDLGREDWRFEAFVLREYPECRDASQCWSDPITRQVFLYWLRKEPLARWERLQLGYSCAEIDELQEPNQSAKLRGYKKDAEGSILRIDGSLATPVACFAPDTNHHVPSPREGL